MNNKSLLQITALISLCFTLLNGCASGDDISNDKSRYDVTEAVAIADSGLEAAIRTALEKPDGELTVGDLLELEVLRAPGKEIADLGGLEYAVNLRVLDLYRNGISDLTSISGLLNLEVLSLSDNDITDLSPLDGLVNLRELRLMENSIRDLSMVEWENLTSLKSLDLRYNYLRLSDPDTAQIVKRLHSIDDLKIEPTY